MNIMEGTRLLILQLLQKNNSDTVEGLAKAIGLAPATIRRHLDILQRDRFVAFEEIRKKTGRPEYSFFLTDDGQETLPKRYDRLLNQVMQLMSSMTAQDIEGKAGSQVLELVFQRLSDQVWKEYEGQVADQDLEQRLTVLTDLLAKEDFSPMIELKDETLQIKLLNCPFRLVALENRAVCSFDENLISNMLALKLEQKDNICDGASGCMYTAHVGNKLPAGFSTVQDEVAPSRTDR